MLSDIAFLGGCSLLILGTALIYGPLGLILTGALLITAAVRMEAK